MKKILVIGHDASLTGAPILLLHLLRLLKSKYHFTIVLKKGGILENEFAKIAVTAILKDKDYSQRKNLYLMLKDRMIYFFRQLGAVPHFYNSDIIFSNTIANGRLLHRFRFFNKPVITYIHELESVLQYFSSKNDTQYSFLHSKFLLYPSSAVKQNLLENHNLKNEKLKYLPYYFPLQNFNFSNNDKLYYRESWIKQWNLSEKAIMVVGMGVVSLRKGTDKFIEIAENVLSKNSDICFFWIGDFDSDIFAQQIQTNYLKKKYDDRLIFTGKMEYAYTNLMPFDLFFMSSVEDPYPLVILEAAYQQVPSICFRNSGGSAEFLENGGGYILENDTVAYAAESILSLIKNKNDLVEKGIRAGQKVRFLHSNEDIIFEVINNVLKD